MITPKPKVTAPVVAFYQADEFHDDHLSIWDEDEDFSNPYNSSDPYVLIGYDGQAWRVQESYGPPMSPKTRLEKFLSWLFGPSKTPSLVGREVIPVQFSLDEFKSEVCRRLPGDPNEVFDDETLVGEDLPPDVDREPLIARMIERLCVEVRAATSIAEVMDVVLAARDKGDGWMAEFARAQRSAP